METNNNQSERLTIRKKVILIDTTFLFDQYSKRGTGRYGKEVIKRLSEIITNDPEIELHFIGFKTLESNLVQLEISPFKIDEIKEKIVFHSVGEPVPSGIRNLRRWKNWYLEIINFLKPDLFFAVHLERGLPTTPHLNKKLRFIPKTVVFVPDAIPLAMPNFKFSSKGYFQHLTKKWFYKKLWEGVQRSDLILTCSEFSKKDIKKFGGVEEEKVKVIYLGISEDFYRNKLELSQEEITQILEVFNVQDKAYLFYDSGAESNKGSSELLYFLSKINGINNLPQYLVMTGGDFTKGTGKNIKAKTKNGQIFLKKADSMKVRDMLITTDRINDEHLITLLQNAKAYINLSTYEGFHFGPVQAMAAEVPAIAFNTSCTLEVTAGGAYLVDNKNLEKAAKEIIKFLQDNTLQKDYVKKGLQVVSRYNWDDTAEHTWKEMKALIGQRE